MGLANIGRLEHNGNIQISSFLKLLLSGFLPALLLLLFMRTLLPFVTNHLSRREGWISHTEIERSALLKSSIFYNVDVIFGSLFASKVYNNLSAFLTSPLETLQGYGGTSRGTTITQTATFFLIFVMINSLVLLPMELMRPITASVFAVRTRFFCRTEFDYQVAWGVANPSLVREVAPNFLLITVGLVYSLIQPLITPFLLLHFWFTRLTWRNQLFHVYERPWDSGGRLWQMVHYSTLAALLTSQLVVMLLFYLKNNTPDSTPDDFFQIYFTIPLVLFTLLYARHLDLKWKRTVSNFPLDVAMGMDGMGRMGGLTAPEPAWLSNAYFPHFMADADAREVLGSTACRAARATSRAPSKDPVFTGDDVAAPESGSPIHRVGTRSIAEVLASQLRHFLEHSQRQAPVGPVPE
eukprot:jgi/Mesvir1/22559/Mv18568-RA.2